MRTNRMACRSLLGLLAFVLLVMVAGQASPSHAATLRQEPLEITTSKSTIRFMVEIADTEESRNRGMMYRRSVAPDKGMLFDFKTPREAAFWMKNTLIPLDIIFITQDGRILTIARNTVPHSEVPIPSGGVIRGVLELAGGRAAQLGIYPGDRVKHRIFKRD
ncbi:MAG: hypothetical protein RJA87_2081 [Pseudomonadota bacterium]